MNTLRRSFTFLRPYAVLAVGAFLAMLMVTGANLYAPQLIQRLIDRGITLRDGNQILIAALGLIGVATVRGLFNFLNAYWSEKTSQGIAFDMRNAIFTRLERLSFSYHDSHQTGQLMTRGTSDVEGVRTFFAQGLLQLISAILTFAGSATILFITEPRLALAALTTIPVIIAIFVYLFSRLGPRFGRVQRNLGQLNNILQENITGIRIVKAFTAEARELNRYQSQNETLYDENVGVVQLFSLGFPTVFFLSNISTLIVIWFGGNLVISNELSLGTLIAFNSYLSFLLMPIFQLGFISQQLSRATASGDRLFEILDSEIEIADRPGATVLPDTIAGHITFEHVHFAYAGTEEDALRGLSCDIKPGETVAIIGPTGSGKSSMINLIARFYDVDEGVVRIDGHDVRDVTVESLRHRVGLVLQDVNLVVGTIRDNIAFGKPDATDREVQRAARAAQAHSFITALEAGYDTVIGERGVGLSGGQRQRIAIARAVLVNPCVLVFDDSTSALDAETEFRILRALAPVLNNVTAIIIAQRISTVRRADRILVVDRGKVVASGKHDELMAQSALYAEIAHSQLEPDEPVLI